METTSNIPWPTIPEHDVVEILLISSNHFREFYESERHKINESIFWAQDLSLPIGIDYRCSMLSTGETVIRLRKVPPLPEDALKVCHELAHIIVTNNGFPHVGPRQNKFEDIASSLDSMLHDLLVDTIQFNYGYNLEEDYQSEIVESKQQLKRAFSPSNCLDRAHWVFNYAGNVLRWELITGSEQNNSFRTWFTERYPDISQRGDSLVLLVKRIGYDTPEKMKILFRKIIRQFDLMEFVTIID